MEKNGSDVYGDIVKREIADGRRLVHDGDRFAVISAYASRQPFETWVLPKNASARFEEASAEDLTQQMRDAKRWLLWRSEPGDKKPRKVPYYASGKHRHGSLDSPEDVSQFVILDDAIKALQTGRYTGLGFALGPDGTGNNWQGIDLDHLPEHPELQHVADTLPGYTERSPSKTGMHAIGYGRTFDGLGSNTTGIEAYSKGRYFTVTADGAGLHDPCDLAEFVDGVLRPLHSPQKTQQGTKQATGSTEYATEYADPQTVQDLRSALGFLKPDSDNRKTWIDVAHYLRKLGTTGFELWDTWSQQL
jgi:hypothetical protein